MERVILYKLCDNDPIFESQIQKDLYGVIGHQTFRMVLVSRSEEEFTIFAFLKGDEVDPLTDIFKKYKMLLIMEDITGDVIAGRMPNSEYKDEFDFVTYRKILKEFREMNTKVDDVLDLILESGIDSLDDIHKKILKNF
jgi:hypothetical protein